MKSGTILLSHGAGGKLSHRLIQDVFLKAFRNPFLEPLNDQAVFPSPGKRLAFTTDSYVVSPIFFPAETSASSRFAARLTTSRSEGPRLFT